MASSPLDREFSFQPVSGVPMTELGDVNGPDFPAEVVERLTLELTIAAQRQLSRRFAAKMDPEDITQSVFRTFFRRLGRGDFNIESWVGIRGLLMRLVACKCRNRAGYFHAQRRDVRIESRLEIDSCDPSLSQTPGTTLPVEQATVNEIFDLFCGRLNSDDQAILAGYMAGYRNSEMGAWLKCSEQTIRRRLNLIEGRLAHSLVHGFALKVDEPS